jgi:hypothetical protein
MYNLPRSISILAAEPCIAIRVNKDFYMKFLQHEENVSLLLNLFMKCSRFSKMLEYDVKILSSRAKIVKFK